MDIEILKKLGFSDKISTVYLTLLRLGPSSVRKLAETSQMNRGSVYEGLKWLQEQGLVDFYEKDAKQYFVAEDPDKLAGMVQNQISDLKETALRVYDFIPELKSLHDKGTERPVARYYEQSEIHTILEDVLKVCEDRGEMVYRIYSTAPIREELYRGFETFSDVRVAKGIGVKAIAIGLGGELRGLDERRWLKRESATPTYIILYPGKTASISLNPHGELIGVVIENEGVFETQKIIFDELWEKLM
jgi:sugar-specific transcriptional regulator TrmB